ncbi:MAG: hypothetical protein Q9224_007753, partial [Gallowayella concinna]
MRLSPVMIWGGQKRARLTYPFISEDWSTWSTGGPQLIKSCGQKHYCCQPSGNNTSCCDTGNFFDLDEAKVLNVIPEHPEQASTSLAAQSSSQTLARARTSSLSSLSTTISSSASSISSNPAASTLRAPASPTISPPAENSNRNDTINKGLAAGLGLALGFALIAGLLFGLYKWDQKRRTKRQAQLLKRSPVPDASPPPTPL